ncbi:hypothetical protein GCM10022245_00520 [Streptomyces mayteni]
MDSDPTPGDPLEVRQLAEELETFADDVGEALGRVRGMAGDRAVHDWAGLSAEAFRSEFDGVPGNLEKLRTSYDLAARALRAYWPTLETAQGMADRALDRAIAARADLSSAQAALSDAQDWVSRAGDEADRLEREGERENVEPPSEAEVRAATRDATAAGQARSDAQGRVDDAEEALSAARALARQAKELREDAAGTCADGIDEASDAGIQNRRWWEDAVHWVSENWDTIVEVCKVVVAVLGIVVMIIGGPLAWVVLAAALVVLADTLYDYANGRASLWDVAFAALDCVPGMRGLTTFAGLTRGMRSLAGMGLRGMANGVRGLATRGRTLLADGMRSAYARVRTAIHSGGTDPVDMATGHMFLPRSDVTLPGTLPFTLTRRVQSGYTAGRWFGPSWSSTLDQHLQVDDQGVVFLAEDGMILAYPHPGTPGTAAFPETGPRWPLTRQADGGYTLTDPIAGHTRHFRRPDRRGECRVLGISDRNDNRVDIDYDAEGAPTAIRHSGGYHLTLTTEHDRVTALALGETVVRRYGYTDGNLTEEINSSGLALRFTYDHRLRVTSWTDRNDHRYAYAYDDRDRCVAEGGEAGHVALTLDYDGTHADWPGARVTTLTTAQGAVSRYVVDDAHQVVAEIDPLGNVTRTEHDAHHRITRRTDALGDSTHITYDEDGLPAEITNPLGHREHRRYDAFGRLAHTTDPSGAETSLSWSTEGHLVRRVGPDGAEERWAYDGEGNRIRYTDANGGATTYEYGPFDLLTARTDPDGARHEFTHDASLRLTSVTGPHRLTWAYEYDAAGRLTAETDFDGRRIRYERDALGRVASRANPLEQRVAYEYDALGRVAARHADGVTTRYTRDPGGRVLSAERDDCLLVFAWDSAGRLAGESVDERALSLTHDAAGRRTARVTPSGVTSAYGYDAAGRRTEVRASDRVVAFGHDRSGHEVERVTGDALAVTQSWDAAGRLAEQTVHTTAGPVRRHRYAYRDDGHLLGVRDDTVGGTRFGLDAVGRVTEVDAPAWRESYSYDPSGNQTTASWPARWSSSGGVEENQGERAYAGTRLVGAGAFRYEHDAAGRVVLRSRKRLSRRPEVWRYGWDAEDRLTCVTGPDGTVWRYRYDPLGRRTAKQRLGADGTTVEAETRFTWDGPLLVEQTTTGPESSHQVVTTWDYEGLLPITQTERLLDPATDEELDSRFLSVVTDAAGAPDLLVDEEGDVVWRARRTLWGLTAWANDSTAHTPLRFPGQYHDPETGLHYNCHRYYNPATARYLSLDPLGLWPSPNPLAYVPNPWRWADPLGLAPYTVANNRPGELAVELMEADFSGLSRITAGTPEFADAVRGGGRFLWALDDRMTLHIIESRPW